MKILKFSAQWCAPCRQQAVLLKDFPEADVVEIDIEEDDNEPLVQQYGVRGLPTMILVDDEGDAVERFTGLTQPSVIRDAIDKARQQQG